MPPVTLTDWLWSLAAWIPPISITALIGLLGFFIGPKLLGGLVERRVQHSLDLKLEALRSTLRKDEQQLQTTVRQYETRLNALQSGALSSMAARRTALANRRLVATERVWDTIGYQHQYMFLTSTIDLIDFSKAATRASGTDQDAEAMKRFGRTILQAGNLLDANGTLKISNRTALSERPFVTPLAWALYSASEMLVGTAILQWSVIYLGTGPDTLKDNASIKEILKKALPDLSTSIDGTDRGIWTIYLPILQERLLMELQRSLEAPEDDLKTVKQANDILAAVADAPQGQLQMKGIEIPAVVRAE